MSSRNQDMIAQDTIVARATAQGEAALAMVRLSGPEAVAIASRIFLPAGESCPGRQGGLGEVKERTLIKGAVIDPKSHKTVDTVLGVKMPAPHSYTGEDVVEITCHGGVAVVRRILEVALAEGARLAEPGEFTRRAFLNGKMDLAQAEAVCDLIRAQTEAASAIALRQIQGSLSVRLRAIQERLIRAAAEIEARLDFAEEDIGGEDRGRVERDLEEVAAGLDSLLSGAVRGRLFREGVRVPIVGKPNTGKSSLFNALVGRERAIVTPHPGTTRDTIETTVEIEGLAVTFIDTAGVRVEPDEIERLGISRTEGEISSGELILFLVDRSDGLDGEDAGLYEKVRGKGHIIVVNKIDLPARVETTQIREQLGVSQDVRLCDVSALLRQNIDGLEREIGRALIGEARTGEIVGEDILVSNLRHIESLRRAHGAVERARGGLRPARAGGDGVSGEFVMVDLQEGLREIGAILGENVDDAILDRIFSTFCIGK
jgi:tRNA modification GTPase